MNTLLEGFLEAIRLIIALDPATYQALGLSIKVTLYALLLSSVAGFPMGILLAFSSFWGKKTLVNLIYTFMGFPPVVAGLLVYLFYSRQGPLGSLQLLFTPHVMIVAQIILALPVIIGLTYLGIKAVDPSIASLAHTLGATRWQISWMVLKEMRLAILGALITAFGAAISEVGAAMLVGGNIDGHTRSLTTALMLETRQGNFARALALGIILITVSFFINILLVNLTERKGLKRYARSNS
jgi:tungstate transport system permease protein